MIDVLRVIEEALDQQDISAAAASKLAVGNPALIKNMQAARGTNKRYSFAALEKLAGVLDLELYFGPRRESSTAALTSFSSSTLPHRGLAKCSLQGWADDDAVREPLPAPSWVDDPDAFYAVARGDSMRPEGIPPGAFCVVSPAQAPVEGDRVWIEDHEGKLAIKRITKLAEDWVSLRGWMPNEGTAQKNYDEERRLEYIRAMHPIIAVYKGQPNVEAIDVQLIPDPRLIGISQVGLDGPGLTVIQATDAQGPNFSHTGVISALALPAVWLHAQGLEPDQCQLVHVPDDALAPTLTAHSTALFDTRVRKPDRDGLYVLPKPGGVRLARVVPIDGKGYFVENSASERPAFHEVLPVLGRIVWHTRST